MPKTLTASDRKTLIRLASELPKGSDERKAILGGLKQAGVLESRAYFGYADRVSKPPKVYVEGLVELPVDVPRLSRGVDAAMLATELKTQTDKIISQVEGFKKAVDAWAKKHNLQFDGRGRETGPHAKGDVMKDLYVSDRINRTWEAPDFRDLPMPERERKEEALGKEFKRMASSFGFSYVDAF